MSLLLLALRIAAASTCVLVPPPGFVDLSTIPGLRLDVKYATAENFTGAPLPGYEAPGAFLRAEPAAALGRVQQRLEKDGLGLVVFDAYRPRRASDAMVEFAERTGQQWMVEQGYVARRSRHAQGHAVDLGLTEQAGGRVLDMGTPFDSFSEASHTARATGAAAENRKRLVDAMAAEGFVNYSREWWHFHWPAAGDPAALDVPYACATRPAGG